MIAMLFFDHKTAYCYKTVCDLLEKAEKVNDKESIAKYTKEKRRIERLFLLA